jgi:cytochrome c553
MKTVHRVSDVTICAVTLAVAALCAPISATLAEGDETDIPAWSELTPDSVQLNDSGRAHREVPGSTKSFTPRQIDDGSNPPDWFPAGHPPAPKIVAHGSPPAVPGCALCHLYSGQGHPESANLAGQPAGYLVRQMADFKSGARLDPARMTAIGKATSDEDAKLAAQWFSKLEPSVWFRVVESDQVPKTWITKDHLRLLRPEGGSEPLGKRIVEVADDSELALDRDPHSGFTTYVPTGSIAEGRRLAQTGVDGRSVACTTCHGPRLEGIGDVPRIAGLSAVYVAHQLAGFRGTSRTGPVADPMRVVARGLTQDDILYLAAYLVSLEP